MIQCTQTIFKSMVRVKYWEFTFSPSLKFIVYVPQFLFLKYTLHIRDGKNQVPYNLISGTPVHIFWILLFHSFTTIYNMTWFVQHLTLKSSITFLEMLDQSSCILGPTLDKSIGIQSSGSNQRNMEGNPRVRAVWVRIVE